MYAPWRLRHRRKLTLLYLLIIISVCGTLFFSYTLDINNYSAKLPHVKLEKPVYVKPQNFLVNTPGCKIPEMKIMDETIERFIFKESDIVCNNGTPALVESNSNALRIIKHLLPRYTNNSNVIKCCYQPFHRVDPKNNTKDNKVEFGSCREFNHSITIKKQEFLKVSCKDNKSEIYKDFFAFVPLKNTSKERAFNDDSLNILIIGIDGISRLNLHRQMPKTVALMNQLDAVEMLGYNKLGDNSFPNQIPVLTGMSVNELKKVCWPNQTFYFDNCPIIWKDFKNAGYDTAFGEDTAWMGLFHYKAKGFKHQPTDYYWNHFNMIADKHIGSSHNLNTNECLGSRPAYKLLLDYITKYSETMQKGKRKFFAYFWSSALSHDYLNKPKIGDIDYHDMIMTFNRTGLLNNTAFILMSDHGIRWGDIRYTYQGSMEERLPFLYITLPKWFTLHNSLLINNLKMNRKRLTTPFDLHETLKDLLNSSNLTKDVLVQRAAKTGQRRSYSLFHNITINRTCEAAGISAHWCACQSSKKLSSNDTEVLEAANFIVNDHINHLLRSYADCAILELDYVLEARLQINTAELLSPFSEHYTIIFRTKPGGGIFESTVRKNVTNGRINFNVTGTVSRINLYRKQSVCISNRTLKLYCYCKHFIE